ncbi:nucleoside recognition protein [Halegenticoccus tardaugens]|uniref:nucleoside recognition protein n=1 Tax=Halegenticoccus tardaugens TaxID=2071624 RepID=UPI00100BA6C2|nr:nucleoside recognition protein [Halegenticoccus tardaugens]
MQSVAQALDWSLAAEVALRVVKIAVAIGVGVFLANVAVAFGAVRYVTWLAYPLTRPANLPREVGTAILTTTASTTAGYGMLAEFRDSGMLDDRATLVAVTINTFFGFAQHIFTFYGPVLIPILGLRVGLMYVGARAAIALGITLAGILAGALFLSERNVNPDAVPEELDAPDRESRPTREKIRGAATSTSKTLRRIVPRLAVVYALVTLLVETYDLAALTAAAEPLTTLLGLPGAAVPVVAVFAFDTTAGAVAIAPLVGEAFTPRQAVATMLIGGIVSFAVSTFKRSVPFQYGIWGASFGSKVVAVNTALKVVFIGGAVAVLLAP